MKPRPSLILDVTVAAIFPAALLFSLFLLFAGHNAPGGGFVGGLVAGSAFVLRYVEGGDEEVRRTARIAPEVLLGTGIFVAVLVGASGWLADGQFLESAKWERELPILGVVKTTTALPFDVGVYLVVVGLVLLVLRTLGAEESPADEGVGGAAGETASEPTGEPAVDASVEATEEERG